MVCFIKVVFPVLMFTAVSVCAQETTNDNCVRVNGTKRMGRVFPFNKTREVRIVSFKPSDDDGIGYALPKVDSQVDTTRLFESITLNQKHRKELTDLLLNWGYDRSKGEEIIVSVNMCYLPRNAILFLDAKGSVFSYIEICFECLRYKTEPKDLEVGEFCHEKFQLLRKFFVDKGIKYVSDH